MTDQGNTPRPVPSLAPREAVTDDDRNRYGLLLDRAAERGLIDPADYEVRLRDLADATSIEQLNRIVTELPAFTPAPAGPTRSRPRSGRATRTSHTAGRSGSQRPSSTPWVLLAVVVLVMAVALVVLGVLAAHLAHTHPSGAAPIAAISFPRL